MCPSTPRTLQAASKYYNSYHEHIPVMILVQKIAGVMQEYTQSGGVRPFGCSIILGGVRLVWGRARTDSNIRAVKLA